MSGQITARERTPAADTPATGAMQVPVPRDARFRDWTGPASSPPYLAPPPVRSGLPAGRNRGLILSLALMVLLPILAAAAYLYLAAQDKFLSQAGFTVRQEEGGAAADLLGGMSQIFGSSGAGHADLLFEYLRSQELVRRIDSHLDLRAHYSRHWHQDPLFSLPPEGSVDQLTRFWRQVLRVSFDRNTGLLLLELRANDPQFAQTLALSVVAESERMINQLNAQSRRDRMRIASADLVTAETRLRAAREALAEFRVSTQIVDPDADIQGRMGVLNNLQQQLAQGLIEHDMLSMITDDNDPRMRQAKRRIEVIHTRISQERDSFANQDAAASETDYPRLIARYESLRADQDMAEQSYSAAIRAQELARSNAERQSLYLALFIPPTLSEEPGYPLRLLLLGLTALFSLLIWAFGVLAWYSLRDRN